MNPLNCSLASRLKLVHNQRICLFIFLFTAKCTCTKYCTTGFLVLKVLFVSCQTPYICSNDPQCVNHFYCGVTANGADVCLCRGVFNDSEFSQCSWGSGMEAVVEDVQQNKTYLFFDAPTTWENAKDYCAVFADIGGLLAIPDSLETHNSLVFNMERATLYNYATAAWLGFSDSTTEGQWEFENGDAVNLPPSFSMIDFTDNATLPLPADNTTSMDGRWHFFHNLGDNYVDFNEAQSFCARFGANLSIINDDIEHDRIIQRVERYANLFSANFPGPPLTHGIFYIGVERPPGDLAGWRYIDGTPIYQDRAWYAAYPNVSIPTDDQLAQFNGWAFPDEPNNANLSFYAPNERELCGAYSFLDSGWIDFSCTQRVHTFCELGPYPFERWHLGGTIPDHSEPNNGGVVSALEEDCGAMRLDIFEGTRFEFSSSLNEFWDDRDCSIDLPFACEINIVDLPASCSTYNPPLSFACIETIQRNTGCNGDISEDHRRNFLSSLTIIALRNHFRVSVQLARNNLDGLFFEACNGSEYLPYSEMTELKFVSERKSYKEAQAYCKQENASLAMVDSAKATSWILRKVVGWQIATGTNSFYIGLNDIQMEGMYRWQDGTYLNIVTDYQNWSPSAGTMQLKDCVVIRAADQWQWSQVDCREQHSFICMRLLPSECVSQGGPHTLNCLLAVWKEQCFEEGNEAPTPFTLASLQNIRISDYRIQNEHLREQAAMGDPNLQEACFGFNYTRNCTSFNPPLSLDCLLELYESSECTEDGAFYPSTLQSDNLVVYEEHRNLNVRDYSFFIREIVQAQADAGVVQHQVNCYGIEFPPGCTSFIGPHSEQCIQSIFLSVGCVEQGTSYPSALSPAMLSVYDADSILEIKETFFPTKINAESGDASAQQECYGLLLTGNCTSFDFVLTRECLHELWINARCIEEGAGNPLTLSPRKYMEWYGTKNLREARDFTNLTQQFAVTYERGYDVLCYGTSFHQYNCTTFNPPHSLSCLLNIWLSIGCVENGTVSPNNATAASPYQINISNVIVSMRQIHANLMNSTTAQQQCYGRTFPDDCTTNSPPFSRECLVSIWLESGCTLNGTQSPSRISDQAIRQRYGNPTAALSSVESSVDDLFQQANSFNMAEEQLQCFGIVVPPECTYYPPLSVTCMDFLWMQGGCEPAGIGFPANLTVLTLPPMQRMALPAYIDHVDQLYTRAISGDVNAQVDCFGYGFLSQCPLFDSPLPVECLNQIWLNFSGCSMQGLGYPDRLTAVQLDLMWDGKNQSAIFLLHDSAVRNEMLDMKMRADAANLDAQLQCYGVELLHNCTYLPPHSDDCLALIWMRLGCTDEGDAFPPSLNNTYRASLYDSVSYPDIFPIVEDFRRSNLDCLGFEIPSRCSLMAPRSHECLLDLFEEAGCNASTGRIPPALMDTYRNLNFPDIREAFRLINASAVNPLVGVHTEVCHDISQDLSLAPDLVVNINFQPSAYIDAARSCRSRENLLLFTITNAADQQRYIDKLQNASMYFDIETWWLGLNDLATEGTFVWENGDPLTGFTNWIITPPQNSQGRDCVYMNSSQNFQWSIGDCSARHGFLCQEVNCVYISSRSAIGVIPTEEQCAPPCSSHQICINGACQCRSIFTGATCDDPAEIFPVAEEQHRDMNYLIFHEVSTWIRASDYCNLLNGTLASPINQTIHDLIMKLVDQAQTKRRWMGLWLGFNDRTTEGDWLFEDGSSVNLAPQFTALNGTDGAVPRHFVNTTSQDERWHFYWSEPTLLLNYTETASFCSQIPGGHLAIVYDKDENNRLYRNALRIGRLARLISFYHKSISLFVYLGLTRNESDLTNWTFVNGDRVFPPRRWYEEGKYAGTFPLPSREDLAKFQLWDFPNPDNAIVKLYDFEPEMCTAVVDHLYQTSAWWDVRCSEKYRPVCELGPFPFERWRHGGTIDPMISEPNDGWCNEDCGGIRLDLSDAGRFDFTGVLTEFWNDFNCDLELPFACAISLPPECPTYSPLLTKSCIDYLRRETNCDEGYLSPSMYDTLSQNSFLAVRSIFADFKTQASTRASGVYHEICEPQDNVFQSGVLAGYVTRINESTYDEAFAECRSLNAFLLVINSDDVLDDFVREKLRFSYNTSGVNLFWIGLTDRRAEGNYEWVTGEPLKTYRNWSPLYAPSDNNKDCVALNVSDDYRWVEVDCNDKNGFFCVDSNDPCRYPTSYSVPYKTSCVYFHVDSQDNQMSLYKKSLNDAIQTCQQSNGNILSILDANDASFFEFNGKEAFNLSFGPTAKFWMPLFDVAPGNRIDPVDRNWMWMFPGQSSFPLTTFNRFVADEFQISNLVQPRSSPPRLPYELRCLYGEVNNNTYTNPLGPYVQLDFVRSRACNDSLGEDADWVWISTYHLLNIKARMCLTAPLEHEETLITAISPALRVRPCNITDPLQQWVCHSRNPLHLKLRAYRYSFVVDRVEPLDRAFIAGGLYGEDCYSLWRTLNNEYICDERYRPAESLFLLRKNPLRPPSLNTRNCEYSDRTTNSVFYGKQEAETACALMGGRIAGIADIVNAMRAGFTEGCACAYVRDDDVLRGFLAFLDLSCQGIPGLPPNTEGLFECSTTVSDYVWCMRGSRATNDVFGGVDFSPNCATYSFLSNVEKGFESRSCYEPHYFACQKPLPGSFCGDPPTPPSSSYIQQDWRPSPMGQGATVRCDMGYGISGSSTVFTATMMCQRVAGVLQWVPDPATITCAPLTCPDLPAPVNATVTNIPPLTAGSSHAVGDVVTYACANNTSLNGLAGMTNFTTTCLTNVSWSPFPIPPCLETRCLIPVVINAQAIYDPVTRILYYSCNEGYWIIPGMMNSQQFSCVNGQWIPASPSNLVYCEMATCENVTDSPDNGNAYFISNRYKDRVIIQCDAGFSLVPRDLEIVCDAQGNWSQETDGDYCRDIECVDQPPQPADINRTVFVKPEYVYGDMAQYTAFPPDTGAGITNIFMILDATRTRCLTSSSTGEVTLETDCEEDNLEMNWMWNNSFQLIPLSNLLNCLTVSGSNVITAPCEMSSSLSTSQEFDCPSVGGSSRNTLALKDGSQFFSISTMNATSLNVTSSFFDEWYARDLSEIQRSVCEMRVPRPSVLALCGRDGEWFPPETTLSLSLVTCPPLPDVMNANLNTASEVYRNVSEKNSSLYSQYDAEEFSDVSSPFTASVGTVVTFQCHSGFWFGPGALQWQQTCDKSGKWLPRLNQLSCLPLTCPAPYDILNAVYIGFDWSHNATINYTCNLGYWFARNQFTHTATCNSDGAWTPDPKTNFQCIAVTCLDPGPRPNMTYSIFETEVNYNAVVEYFCDENFYFSAQRFTSVGVVCTADGTYSPPVSSVECQLAECPIPFPINNAKFSFASHPSYVGSVMTVECLLGYKTRAGRFAVNVTCDKFGQWQPDPYIISCQVIFCSEPYVVPNAVLTGRGFMALSTRRVTCDFGYFIDQLANIRTAVMMCDPKNGTWTPANIQCLRAECRLPAPVLNSFLYQSASAYYFGGTAVFRCFEGYETPTGQFEFATTCQINASFVPDISTIVCQRKSCILSSTTFSNGVLSSAGMPVVNTTNYFYEDVITLACDESFWVFTDKGRSTVDFVCFKTGYFEPNPRDISCTAVQCPLPPPKIHSILEVTTLSVGSTATYQCAEGFGMMTQAGLLTTWSLTCRASGEWRDSPSAIMCQMVDCGEPPVVPFSTRSGDAYTYKETVTYTCLKGRWFERNVFEQSIICAANRTWIPKLPKCSIVSCPDPASISDNLVVFGNNFLHRSMVTVICNKGYHISPTVNHVLIQCLSTGVWDYPVGNQTCVPIECPEPPVVWYALSTGSCYNLNAVVTYQCDPNYMISLQRNINSASITCTESGLWQPDPSFIVCAKQEKFECPVPAVVANARLYASGFAINSTARVTCLNGFWISPSVFSARVRCLSSGYWLPNLSRILCRPIRCRRLPPSATAIYYISSTSYNSQATIACRARHSIVTNFTGEARITSMKRMIFVCGKNGRWQPDVNQVTCRRVYCPVPVLHSSIFSQSPVRDVNVGATYLLSCLPGFFISPGILSTTITCLETGVWAPNPTTLSCKQIQCGVRFIPAHGSFSGVDVGYLDKIKFQCDTGYRMPFVNKYLEVIERTSVDLVCGVNGFFMGIRTLIDCEIITCRDPGYHVGATRSPSAILLRHPLGTEVKYTCQNNSWFYRNVRSLSYTCKADGLWYHGGSTVLPPCRIIACWSPPSIFNSQTSSNVVSDLYEFRDDVTFRCSSGYKFNVEPECNCSYYSITCLNNGLWSNLPDVLACEAVTCDTAPYIEHSTLQLRAGTLLPSAIARYRCNNGFSAVRMGASLSVSPSNEFVLECSADGRWFPDASLYSCQVLRCPDPPDSIPNGIKQGRVYETGFHVTYTCRTGYTVRGSSFYQGLNFVTIVCGFTAAWNTDVTQLACREIICGNPPVVLRASIASSGISYRARARYQCATGYFIGNNAIDSIDVICNASGKWEPAPSTIKCRPFVCPEPDRVENAEISGELFFLRSTIIVKCIDGYTLDNGNFTFQSQSTSITSVCLYPQSWSPSLSSLACVPVYCSEPDRPPRTYIVGGIRIQNGNMAYRFGDVISLTCAVGYYFNGTNRSIGVNARCQADGNWSINFRNFKCIEVKCFDPEYKLFAFRGAVTLQYRSRVRYTCLRGFVIQPGITEMVIECSFQGEWIPSLEFECLAADCGEPPNLNFTTKQFVSSNFTGVGGLVKYTAVMDGYIVTAERDATGKWYTESTDSTSVLLSCQPDGRWYPALNDLRVIEPIFGVTLFDLVPNGFLVDLFSYSPFRTRSALESRSRYPLLTDVEISQLSEQTNVFQNDNEEFANVMLFASCEEEQIFVIHDFGKWLRLPVGRAETQHIPLWWSESGFEARLENMFDGDPNTFWMPVEAPSRDEVATNWPGWEVIIDLGRKHVIGSFRLRTSRNYVNDVKTFYVLTSVDKGLWIPLGPFYPHVSSEEKRKEFFYEFEPVEARYIRLRIISTFLYGAPIITEFGVFAATFECADRLEYATDLFLVPLFVIILLLMLMWRLISGVRNEEKKRWKRYLLKSPSRFKVENRNPERIYEINFKTTANTGKADVLLKLVGSAAISPILWLRSNFKGGLRPGYTDSHVIQVPKYLGNLQRVDVMSVYTSTKPNQIQEKIDSTKHEPPKSDKSRSSSVLQKAFSAASLFKNETRLLFKPSSGSLINFVSRRHKNPLFSFRELTVADPGSGEKWLALLPKDVDSTLATFTKDWWMGKKGVYMPHGCPKCFLFQSVRKVRSLNFSIYTLCTKCFLWIRIFYREHFLFNCSSNALSNLTYVEKYLVGFSGIFSSLLVSSLYQGFSNQAFYFMTRLNEDSSVIRYILSSIPQYSVFVTFMTSFFLMLCLLLSVRILAGSWERQVEHKLSYWQGAEIVKTSFFLIKCSLLELVHLGCLYCFPLAPNDKDAETVSHENFDSDDDSYRLPKKFKEKLRSSYDSFLSADEDVFTDAKAQFQNYPRQGVASEFDDQSMNKNLTGISSQISGFSISKNDFLRGPVASRRHPELITLYTRGTKSIVSDQFQEEQHLSQSASSRSTSANRSDKLSFGQLSPDLCGQKSSTTVACSSETQGSIFEQLKSPSILTSDAGSSAGVNSTEAISALSSDSTQLPTLDGKKSLKISSSLPVGLKLGYSGLLSSYVSKSLNYLSSLSKSALEKYFLKKEILKSTTVRLNDDAIKKNSKDFVSGNNEEKTLPEDKSSTEKSQNKDNQRYKLTPLYVSSFYNKLCNMSSHSFISDRLRPSLGYVKNNCKTASNRGSHLELNQNEPKTPKALTEKDVDFSNFLLEVKNYDLDLNDFSEPSVEDLSHLKVTDCDISRHEPAKLRHNLSLVTISGLNSDESATKVPFPSGHMPCSKAEPARKSHKFRRQAIDYEGCKKYNIVLHVITYRSHPPKPLVKKPYHPLLLPDEGQEIGSAPGNYSGVALRFCICVFCAAVILVSSCYIMVNGFLFTTDGTSYDLVKSFFFNIAVLVFLVMPLIGWIVYFACRRKGEKHTFDMTS